MGIVEVATGIEVLVVVGRGRRVKMIKTRKDDEPVSNKRCFAADRAVVDVYWSMECCRTRWNLEMENLARCTALTLFGPPSLLPLER